MMDKRDKRETRDKPLLKGWCPGAWRPMATGDGLLVRVRPRFGRLTREQLLALCAAAEDFGSGLIELTSRANLQLRGVSQAAWPGLMATLVEHGLVDSDPEAERRPPLLLAPDWRAGDATHEVARLLEARLAELPALPAKWGLAIDAGAAPLLGEASADLRIERAASGALWLVRADGRARGTPVASPQAAVELLVRLAHWFVESGGRDAGRMRRHQAPLPPWAPATTLPASILSTSGLPASGLSTSGLPIRAGQPMALGRHPAGRVLGLPFGRVAASVLRAAIVADSAASDSAVSGAVSAVRVTPWRRLLLEGFPAEHSSPPGLLDDECDPRLAMQACPGAPHCEQASVATLGLARALAERRLIAGTLHLSGCAKGCASQQPTDLCLTGRGGRFDLILGDRADGPPAATGLSESDVIEYLEKNRDALRL